MLDETLILFTIALLLLSIKWANYLPFPTGFIAILGVSQILFALAHAGFVHYNMLDSFDYGGLQTNYLTTQVIYSSAALISLTITAGKHLRQLKNVKLDSDTLASLYQSNATLHYVFIVIIFVALHLLMFLVVVDWNKLWFHRLYLEPLFDYGVMKRLGEPVSATIVRTTPLFAILSVVASCLLRGTKSVFFKSFATIICACYFLLLLAINSRSSAFVPALVAIYYMVFRVKGRLIMLPVMGILAAFAIVTVLTERGGYEHGLSMIPSYVERPFLGHATEGDPSQVGLDLCQGIFVTAESFQITGPFPRKYMNLAFSPLPSLIDGYSRLSRQSEHRLATFVPMSGIGEAINFGWPYVCILIAVMTLIVRTHVKLASRNPVVFLLCNFLTMFCAYLLFSYPLRNALRFGWLAFFVALLELYRQGRISKGSSETKKIGGQAYGGKDSYEIPLLQ